MSARHGGKHVVITCSASYSRHMETSNVTVRLDKDVIRRAKIAAARRDMSVSALLSRKIQEMSELDERYEEAKRRAMEALGHAGDRGGVSWTREELHER